MSECVYYDDIEQGSDEWLELRRGVLTASEMKLIITPAKMQYANNDKQKMHVFDILAQRITGYTEPHYINDDMIRGSEDEIVARDLYSFYYDQVEEVGFCTNDKFGFTLGYSPDGLVGDDGLIEIKSRLSKHQIKTIIDGGVPDEYLLQIHTGMIVTGRKWCDFLSYSGGIHMPVIRVHENLQIQESIILAATKFEEDVQENLLIYKEKISSKNLRMIPTERKTQQNEEISL